MWYPATVTVSAAAEPVSLSEAKSQVSVSYDDDDDLIAILIESARDHVERYCGTRFATQTVSIKCDSFDDMERLSESPVQSVSSVTYLDTDGAEQTLATSVYDLRNDGFETSIVLKYAQTWPSIQQGSRITVTAVVGYASVPPAVKHAMLLMIDEGYNNRSGTGVTTVGDGRGDSTMATQMSTFDNLLQNHRRGI